MALRIIRKSSSQSQVELIRGKSEAKPLCSLLCFLDNAEQVAAAKQLVDQSEWIQNHVQCLFMKSQALSEPLRPHFAPMEQTTKLLSEPKDASWSLRLRTLMQEASSEHCLFLAVLPESDVLPVLRRLEQALREDPSLGLVAPALGTETEVLAAGQDLPHDVAQHSLRWADGSQTLDLKNDQLAYLYQGLSLKQWQTLASGPLQVAGAPLLVAGLRREAYFSLNWSDQPYTLPWLAQDLAFGLRQQQYRLAVVPEIQPLTASEQVLLEPGEASAALLETWLPVRKNTFFPLYLKHGWLAQGSVFLWAEQPQLSLAQSYLATKVAQV